MGASDYRDHSRAADRLAERRDPERLERRKSERRRFNTAAASRRPAVAQPGGTAAFSNTEPARKLASGGEPARSRASGSGWPEIGWLGRKRTSKQLQAFGHGAVWIFFAFEFERDVSGVTRITEDFRDPLVIEIERVPFATTKISLRLHEDSFGRNLG